MAEQIKELRCFDSPQVDSWIYGTIEYDDYIVLKVVVTTNNELVKNATS